MANRRTPRDSNAILPYDGKSYQNDIDDEVVSAFRRGVERVTVTSGINALIGNTVTADQPAGLTAYGPTLVIRPLTTNTLVGESINVDNLGVVNILDSDGNALIPGEFVGGRDHLCSWDGVALRLIGNGAAPPAVIAQPGPVVLDVQTAAASSSLIVPASVLTSAYSRFELIFDSIKFATDDQDFDLRIGSGAGPTFATAGYSYTVMHNAGLLNSGAAAQIVMTGRVAGPGFGVGNAAGKNLHGNLTFSNPTATDFMVVKFALTYNTAAGGLSNITGGGFWSTAGVVTGLQLFASAGNLVGGTMHTMGWPKV